jgi:hypothetical protein
VQQTAVPEPVFLNVEFIFSWLWGHVAPIFTREFLASLKLFASLLLILAIALVLYCIVRIYEIKQEDKKKEAAAKASSAPRPATADRGASISDTLPGATAITQERNETWEHIRANLLSDSPSDWRLGIIEADIYLDRLLDDKGYRGDTMGDKLKNLTDAQLPSLQIAWEAHKVRNRIAHDGAAFVLTMPEARRTLSYFEIVFRDLGAIA